MDELLGALTGAVSNFATGAAGSAGSALGAALPGMFGLGAKQVMPNYSAPIYQQPIAPTARPGELSMFGDGISGTMLAIGAAIIAGVVLLFTTLTGGRRSRRY